MKTLSEKIIEQLQNKHDSFLGTKGEEHRQKFKNGLAWAIDTVETLTEIDKCEKEYEAEQLLIQRVVEPKGTSICKQCSGVGGGVTDNGWEICDCQK